jgi:hypothetical protein
MLSNGRKRERAGQQDDLDNATFGRKHLAAGEKNPDNPVNPA